MACIVKYVGNNAKIKAFIPEKGIPEESFKAWLLNEGLEILQEAYPVVITEDNAIVNIDDFIVSDEYDSFIPDAPEDAFMLLSEPIEYKRNTEEIKSNLISIFGQDYVDNYVKVVEGLIEGVAYGKFAKDGKILISNINPGGTEYHEAFHRVFRLFTTPSEQFDLIDSIKKRPDYKQRLEKTKELYGNLRPDYLAEEILAEDFSDYVLTNGNQPKALNIFERIWKFLKALFIDNKLEDFYDKILSGYYQGKNNTSVKSNDAYSLSPDAINISVQSFNALMISKLNQTVGIAQLSSELAQLLNSGVFNNIEAYKEFLGPRVAGFVGNEVISKADWDKIYAKHKEFIKQFVKLPDEEIDEYEVTDKLGIKESNKVSVEDLDDSLVKLVISGLPVLTQEGKVKRNSIGLPEAVDFNQTLKSLHNSLANTITLDEQLKILKEQSVKHPEYTKLIEWFGLDKISKTPEESLLKIKFVQSFAKAKAKFVIAQILPYDKNNPSDPTFKIIEEKDRAITKIQDEWKANLTRSERIVKITPEGKYIIDNAKLQEYLNTLNSSEILELLGYPDSENFSKYTDRTPISKIYSLLKEQTKDFNIDYIFDKNGLGIRKEITQLSEQALLYNDVYSDLNILDSKNAKRYALSLHSALSVGNNLISTGKQDYLGNFDLSTSLWYKSNRTLINLAQAKSNVGTGLDFDELDENTQAIMYYRYVLNNMYPVLPSGDRKVEMGWQLEMPELPSIDSLVNAVFGEINYINNKPKSARENAVPKNELIIFREAVTLTKPASAYNKQLDFQDIKTQIENFIEKESKINENYLKSFSSDHFTNEPEDNFRTFTIRYWQSIYEQANLYTGSLDNFKDPFKRFTLFTSAKTPTINEQWINDDLNKFYPRQDGKLSDGYENEIIFKDIEREYQDFILGAIDSKETGEVTDASAVGTLDYVREMMVRLGQWSVANQAMYDYETYKTDVYPPAEGYVVPKKYGYSGPLYYKDGTPSFYITGLNKMAVTPILPRSMKYTMPKLVEIGSKMLKVQAGIAVFKSGNKGNIAGEVQDVNADNYEITQRVNYSFFGEHLETTPEEHYRVTFGTQMGKLSFVDVIKNPKFKPTLDRYNDLLNNNTMLKFNKFLDKMDLEVTETTQGKEFTFLNRDKLVKEVQNAMLQRKTSLTFKEQLAAILSDPTVIQADAMAEKVKLEQNLMAFYNREVVKRTMSGEMYIQIPDMDNTLKFYEPIKDGVSMAEVKIALPSKLISLVNSLEGSSFEDKLKLFNTEYLPKFREQLGLVPYRIPTQGQNAIEAVVVKEFLAPTLGNVIVVPNGITIKAGSDFDVDKLTTYIPHYYVANGEVKILGSKDVLEKDIQNVKKQLFVYEKQLADNNLSLDVLQKEEFESYRQQKDITEDDIKEGVDYFKDKIQQLQLDPVVQSLLMNFADMQNMLNNYEEYGNENEIINIIIEVVTAPEAIENLLTSDSTADLQKVAKQVIAKHANTMYGKPELKEGEYTKIMSFPNVVSTRNKLLQFKSLVGPAALATTSHALFQQANISYIKPGYKLYFNGFEYTTDFDMSAEYDINNEQKISAILKQFISGAVDVSKIGNDYIAYINVNFQTFDVVNLLLRQRVPLKDIIFFLNQPIIRAYVDRLQEDRSLSNFDKVGKQWEIQSSLLDSIDTNANMRFKELSKKDIEPKSFNTSELKEQIGKTLELMNPEEIQDQIDILYQFTKVYKPAATDLIKVQQASSQDTKQAGKTLIDSWLRRKLFQDVISQGVFNNLDNLFEDTLLKALKETAFEADKIWSSGMEFISFNDAKGGPDIMNTLYELYKTSGTKDLTSVLEKADRELVTYALLTSPQASGKSISEYSNLLTTPTLVNELLEYKEKFPDNKFLKELIPLLPEEGKIKGQVKPRSTYNIKLVSQRVSSVEQEVLAEGFKELYNNPITQPFAKKLIAVQLLQSGISTSPISYQNLLPFEYVDIAKEALNNTPLINTIEFIESFIRQNAMQSKGIARTIYKKGYQPNSALKVEGVGDKGPALIVKTDGGAKYLLIKNHTPQGYFTGDMYLPVTPIGEGYYYHAYKPNSKISNRISPITTETIEVSENLLTWLKNNKLEKLNSLGLTTDNQINDYLEQIALDQDTTIDNAEFIEYIKSCF